MKRKKEIELAMKEAVSETIYACGWITPQATALLEWAFTKGAEWADKTMLDRACEWLKETMYVEHIFEYSEDEVPVQYVCASVSDSVDEFVNNFRKAMEE